MRTFNLLILAFVFFYCISCSDSNNQTQDFTITDEDNMLEKTKVFISAVNKGDLETEFLFREDSVLYWDYNREGNMNYIPPNISFSQIVEFNDLMCDSIYYENNSLIGIYSKKSNAIYHFTFFFNKNGRIDEVLNVKTEEFIYEHPFQWGNDNAFHLKE